MNNISLETSTFSEQLGLYDFFNVIISGAVFIFSIIFLFDFNGTLPFHQNSIISGIGIVLLVYISGMVLQELSSGLDYYFFRTKHLTRSTFLFDLERRNIAESTKYWFSQFILLLDELSFFSYIFIEEKCNEITLKGENYRKIYKKNYVLNNPTLLAHYRKLAREIYSTYFPDQPFNDENYNDEKFNSFIFSTIQYHVSSLGKDKKVEKLRALYSLARTLLLCYLLLFGLLLLITVPLFCSKFKLQIDVAPPITGVLFCLFLFLIILFFRRMRKCKKYMALIMLGNYDALLKTTNEHIRVPQILVTNNFNLNNPPQST